MTQDSPPVQTSDAKPYGNQYRQTFENHRFKQTVRIDQLTCVYQAWAGTAYQFKFKFFKT